MDPRSAAARAETQDTQTSSAAPRSLTCTVSSTTSSSAQGSSVLLALASMQRVASASPARSPGFVRPDFVSKAGRTMLEKAMKRCSVAGAARRARRYASQGESMERFTRDGLLVLMLTPVPFLTPTHAGHRPPQRHHHRDLEGLSKDVLGLRQCSSSTAMEAEAPT